MSVATCSKRPIRSRTPLSGEYNDPINPDLETRIIDRRTMVIDREYNDRGNVKRVVERGPLNAQFAEPIITSFTYEEERVTSITNTKNQTTVFDYDDRGNLVELVNAENNVSTFTYDANGRRESFTDFNGNTTTFEDYSGSQPRLISYADGSYTNNFTYRGVQYGEETYEADGTIAARNYRAFRATSINQTMWELDGEVTDGKANHVRTYYTDEGLVDWEVVVSPESTQSSPLNIRWGAIHENMLVHEGTETPETPIEDRKSRITDYEYDDNDRLIRQTDSEGGVVNFRYDAQGNRVLLQDPVGNITTWVYDALNRVAEERDPPYWDEVISSDPVLPTIPNDQLLERIAPLVPLSPANPDDPRDPLYDDTSGVDLDANVGAPHIVATGYDAEGNRSKVIDRNGRRREFEYDYAGRLEEERWYAAPDHPITPGALVERITFTYDVLCNMATATDSNSEYLFTYDDLNRLKTVDNNPNGTRDVSRVILTYAYDPQGNVTLTQDDAGVTVESDYDARNRLDRRNWFDADDSGDVDDARIDFEYDAAGRESAVRRYSDLDGLAENLVGRTERTYDLAGRSDLLNHLNAVDELLAGYDYDYDFSGLLTHESRTHQDEAFAQEIDYHYDLTGQLTDALFEKQDDEHYKYDLNGNRLFSRVGPEENPTEEQTYAPAGPANQLVSDGNYRYEYDGEGNQVMRVPILANGSDDASGTVRTFIYDHNNRLVQVDDWSSDPGDPLSPATGVILMQTVEYTYDAFGGRIAREVDADGAGPLASEVEYFVNNGEDVWVDLNGTTEALVRYLFGNRIDQNIADFDSSSGTVWYLTDRVGSVFDLANSSGTLNGHNDFESFGEILDHSDEAMANRFAFAGREFDTSLGQYYFRSRMYDANLGAIC